MMKEAGINVVRIAESTWGTLEPQDGMFDFSHIDRVLDAMHRASIGVIVGTPTYAVPTWLARKYPDVLAITPRGPNQYGPRQNMDITNPHFRVHAERVIRRMLEHVKDHPAIIGYQVDNETKHYQTAGPAVQALFVRYMKEQFRTLDAINRAFGLDYWSNRINSWEDFPSTVGSINASLNAEFARFQRQQVTDYLAWQAAIVREYARPGQFVTQNFDLEWRGYSYGIQPDVDHFAAARAMDVAGIDIYHPTQDALTGTEISFGGDLARSMKSGPELPRHGDPGPGVSRSGCRTPASCGCRRSATSRPARTWSRTGTGTRSTTRRRPTGRACSATTSGPTPPTTRRRRSAATSRRSARTWSTCARPTRWRSSSATRR